MSGPDKVALAKMIIHTDRSHFPELDTVQVAIVGVLEERRAVNNTGCSTAPDVVRASLYQLFHHWPSLNVADLETFVRATASTTPILPSIRWWHTSSAEK